MARLTLSRRVTEMQLLVKTLFCDDLKVRKSCEIPESFGWKKGKSVVLEVVVGTE